MWGPHVLYTLKPYQSNPQPFTSMTRWGAYATPSTTTLVSPPVHEYLLNTTCVDGSCPPASCHHCCLRPLKVFILQVEFVMKQDRSTGGHVFTCAIARLVQDLAKMPKLVLMQGVILVTSGHAW